MIASIQLQQLRCTFQPNIQGCQPYLWGVLLQVDDDTINSGALVATASFAPSPDGSFTSIAPAMHGGDSAPIPGAVSRYVAWFRSGQTRKDLILVVALWAAQDTPLPATAAGYDAFLGEIRDAVAANLLDLSNATDDEEKAIEDKIKQRVHDKVEAAIKDQLSDLDKVQIEIGLEIPDRLLDSAFRHVTLQETDSTTPFTLPFNDVIDDFQLDAKLTVTADPCESELTRVRAGQQTIENIRGALKQLSNQPESSKVEKEIEELENELVVKKANLAQAQNDLAQCRIANA
jgi:hypothetical protein